MRGETQLDARWDISDSDGHLLMRAEGWEDREFTATERFFALRLDPARARLSTPALEGQLPAELCVRKLEPLPEGMLEEAGQIWKRMLAPMMLSGAARQQFHRSEESRGGKECVS